MKLIIGLGNPGKKYENNRHNVGFHVAEALAIKLSGDGAIKQWRDDKKFGSSLLTLDSSLILAKPQTFMNDSGRAVAKLVNWYKIEPNDVYVIHDDLDISLGAYKIQKGKGPRLHYGVQSIEKALGTEDFWRVRIGVDNRSNENRTPGEQYVLQDFTEEEMETVNEVIDKIIKELSLIIQSSNNPII